MAPKEGIGLALNATKVRILGIVLLLALALGGWALSKRFYRAGADTAIGDVKQYFKTEFAPLPGENPEPNGHVRYRFSHSFDPEKLLEKQFGAGICGPVAGSGITSPGSPPAYGSGITTSPPVYGSDITSPKPAVGSAIPICSGLSGLRMEYTLLKAEIISRVQDTQDYVDYATVITNPSSTFTVDPGWNRLISEIPLSVFYDAQKLTARVTVRGTIVVPGAAGGQATSFPVDFQQDVDARTLPWVVIMTPEGFQPSYGKVTGMQLQNTVSFFVVSNYQIAPDAVEIKLQRSANLVGFPAVPVRSKNESNLETAFSFLKTLIPNQPLQYASLYSVRPTKASEAAFKLSLIDAVKKTDTFPGEYLFETVKGPAGAIGSFTVTPQTLTTNIPATLAFSWATTSVNEVAIKRVGEQPAASLYPLGPSGSTTVALTPTTQGTIEYELSAWAHDGSLLHKKVAVSVELPKPKPTADLKVNGTDGPASVFVQWWNRWSFWQQGVTFGWSSTNASSCQASGGWIGPRAAQGSQFLPVFTSGVYTLSCVGAGGTAIDSVQVKAFVQNCRWIRFGFWRWRYQCDQVQI